MGFLFIFMLFAVILGLRIKNNLDNDRAWDEGLFENQDQINEEIPRDPMLEAYISLGALMVRKDIASYSEKILYMDRYFAKHFPKTHYNFGMSFTDSLKNPIQPKTITKWLNRKLPQQSQRIQIMYFLAGLSTIDGSINENEMALLKELNTFLELSPKDFESIISIYTQKQQQTQERVYEKPKISAIQLACKIIGVSEHAQLDEVKKAYRKLVKLHHPDRFATDTAAQQKIAAERFMEIQKAYEILEKRL